MFKEDLYKQKMTKTFDVFVKELASLRTGRANASMLDLVKVDVYGQKMPINQLGNISVPEPRMLTVSVWDNANAPAVEKAIRNAGLGLNPMAEGATIRVPVPDLSQERRVELTKVAAKYAENARISVRNVRKDGMDSIKQMEKDKSISEDESKRLSDEVQKLTDDMIKKIDTALADKEKDITTV